MSGHKSKDILTKNQSWHFRNMTKVDRLAQAIQHRMLLVNRSHLICRCMSLKGVVTACQPLILGCSTVRFYVGFVSSFTKE